MIKHAYMIICCTSITLETLTLCRDIQKLTGCVSWWGMSTWDETIRKMFLCHVYFSNKNLFKQHTYRADEFLFFMHCLLFVFTYYHGFLEFCNRILNLENRLWLIPHQVAKPSRLFPSFVSFATDQTTNQLLASPHLLKFAVWVRNCSPIDNVLMFFNCRDITTLCFLLCLRGKLNCAKSILGVQELYRQRS